MNSKVYTEALINTLDTHLAIDKALAGLRAVLESRGHSALYLKILKDTKSALEKKVLDKTATITLARKSDEKVYANAIEYFLQTADAKAKHIVIDEHIVGGFIAKTKTKKQDQSYRESLASVYRSLTAH